MDNPTLFQQFLLGFKSSFLGSLPLGMLNMTILQMAIACQFRPAMLFSIGASLVGFFQIFLTLASMNVLLSIPRLGDGLSLISVVVLVFLGIQNLRSKTPKGKIFGQKSAFYWGLKLSLANVLIYPFWLLWGNVFVQNHWLLPQFQAITVFSIGASLGTLLAFGLFVFFGKIVMQHLTQLQNTMNKLVAMTFFGFAAFQLYTVFKHHIG
jgi:threonine/homoserine/homoserine lactone efflux protein